MFGTKNVKRQYARAVLHSKLIIYNFVVMPS